MVSRGVGSREGEGGEHLWHKHFKRFEFGFSFECGFGRQLFNTHMGIYECLVSAQLESARHLAKKESSQNVRRPKIDIATWQAAAAQAAAPHSKISQLFDDY